MKKQLVSGTIIVTFIIIMFQININQKSELTYVYNESMLSDFYFEESNVVFLTVVVVKNQTNKDCMFYMSADLREDKGLVTVDYASAYLKESNELEQFLIKGNETKSFNAYFKAQKGNKVTKWDRLPPNDIKFQIIK